MDYKMTPVSVTMAYVGKAWHKDNLLLIYIEKKKKKMKKFEFRRHDGSILPWSTKGS